MKALLWHCRHYSSKVKELANTPVGIKPEPLNNKSTDSQDCVAIFITVEKGDDIDASIPKLADDVRTMIRDTSHKNVVIVPFAHLSSNLAPQELALRGLDLLQDQLKEFNPKRVHFGSDKSLLLDVYGHRGAVRFREF